MAEINETEEPAKSETLSKSDFSDLLCDCKQSKCIIDLHKSTDTLKNGKTCRRISKEKKCSHGLYACPACTKSEAL